ncbi:head-tail connector protein [Sulfitobacter aestuariivivens]|uniref:Phage head-tail connector protein n=1 Tax=Sulfitobacter aestuariivivens TaxID=2766981 RepID=A0A927D0T6_9RHOB|nr:head-tail connector protein [Sulfitobacter aestuariivivens]MBD3662929.1 phage head-tail connector protein [Sulfitobacter aestuariivivens]
MMLIEETSVPDAALPVDAFKAHLRLGSGFGQEDVQDAVVRSFLRAAIAAIEARTGKVLIARAFSWTLTYWRDRAAQRLPVAPVSGITRVAIVAGDGSQTDVAADAYWLEADAQRPALRASGAVLPAIPKAGSVTVEFDAGFGADWADLPADLQQAVLMLAAHYYEYRNDTGLSDGCMPFGVSSLIERFKGVRIGFGAGT